MKKQKTRQTLRKTIIFISFLCFPVTLNWFSPYLIVDAGFAGIISGSFLTFTALFFSSLFLGRSFSSWACPAGGLQDCASGAAISKPGPRGRADWIKFIIWVPWISFIVFSFVQAGGITGADPLWKIDQGVSVSNAGMLLFIFLPIVFLFAILGLTLGCPMSLEVEQMVRAEVMEHAECILCGECVDNCPGGVISYAFTGSAGQTDE